MPEVNVDRESVVAECVISVAFSEAGAGTMLAVVQGGVESMAHRVSAWIWVGWLGGAVAAGACGGTSVDGKGDRNTESHTGGSNAGGAGGEHVGAGGSGGAEPVCTGGCVALCGRDVVCCGDGRQLPLGTSCGGDGGATAVGGIGGQISAGGVPSTGGRATGITYADAGNQCAREMPNRSWTDSCDAVVCVPVNPSSWNSHPAADGGTSAAHQLANMQFCSTPDPTKDYLFAFDSYSVGPYQSYEVRVGTADC